MRGVCDDSENKTAMKRSSVLVLICNTQIITYVRIPTTLHVYLFQYKKRYAYAINNSDTDHKSEQMMY